MNVNAETLLTGKASQNTVESYALSWQLYTDFCGSVANALNPQSLIRWREEMIHAQEKSVSTINSRMFGVKRVIKELASQGKLPRTTYYDFREIEHLPANAMPERRRKNNRTRISPKEMRAMIAATNVDLNNPVLARDRAILLTLATSGMRSSEVTRVKVEDVIDLGNGCAIDNVVVKGGRTRRVPITRECYDAIKDWLFLRPIYSEWVFTTEKMKNPFVPESDTYVIWTDTPISREVIAYVVKKYAEIAGVKHVKPHDFRRFVGTTLAKKDIRVAQKVLGHANINTTAQFYLLDEVEPGATEGMF